MLVGKRALRVIFSVLFLVVQNGWKVAGLKIFCFNFCGWTRIWRTLLWEFGDKVPFFCKQNKVFFLVSMDSIVDFVFTKDLVFLEGLFDGCYCVGS